MIKINNKLFIFLIISLIVNITPASAVEMGQMANELNEIKNSDDIQTIEKWNNKGGWYRFWHFAGFCKAANRLSSKAEDIKSKVSDLNSSLNATYENLTTIKAFMDEQENLDNELDNFLAGNGSHSSPQTAIADANYIQSELKSTNKTIEVSVNGNVNKPQNGDMVQLISDVSENNNTGRYNLNYWLFKGVIEDSDTGESMVQLYNGEEYVTIPLKTFNKRFTGVVLNVKDIATNTTITNQTNSNPVVKSVNTKTAKNNSAAEINQSNSQKKVSAQLCSIVITIQTIQKNHLNSMKDLIPAYDSDLAHLLSLLAMIFAIVGTVLWCVGGILCCTPLLALGVVLCVTGGLFLVASSAMSFYVTSMTDSSDQITILDHMLENVDSLTVP